MGQMIEGRWDCSSCGKKMIQGRYKHCPGCGKGRGADVKFYVADPNDVVAADVPEKGPDWLCEYCGAYAPDSAKFCTNCGAQRSDKTYFDVQQEQEEKAAQEAAAQPERTSEPARRRSPILPLILLAALAAFIIFQLIPRNADARVTAKSWMRQVAVESYVWVDDSGWALPQGAVLTESRREIRDYERVLDHYETRSRQVPEQYISGYSTEYQDMGNGYFQSVQIPQYATRYRTEYYDEAVYRNEPIYDTRYYYQIQRWIYNRTLTASGEESNPYWPEETLQADTERTGERDEQYAIQCEAEKNTYTIRLPLTEWQTYNVGDKVNLELSSGGTVRRVSHAE